MQPSFLKQTNRDILKNRHQILLLSLLVLFFVVPLFDISLMIDIVAMVVLFAALVNVIEKRRIRWICLGLLILFFTTTWAAQLEFEIDLVIIANVSEIFFFVVVTGVLLNNVFNSPVVTREVLAGAINVYILLGFLWAKLYIISFYLDPGAFSVNALAIGSPEQLPSPRVMEGHFMYFSLVTLSTLGYGDVLPLTRSARVLAATEAIIGQLYLAVLIARLVGQLMNKDQFQKQ